MKDRQIAAKKGQMTKLRKRVLNGVCPCCNRYFENLHRHMTGQHPGWNLGGEPEATDADPQTATPASRR